LDIGHPSNDSNISANVHRRQPVDIFWLKEDALEESANLPPPGIIAADIVDDLEAALAQFAEIAADSKE
jgi:hypothetical protein